MTCPVPRPAGADARASTTSIHSHADGIVAWLAPRRAGRAAGNIEVHASHGGPGLNAFEMTAIADRRSRDLARWKPFDRGGPRRLFSKAGR